MTTIINFISYEGLYQLGIENLTANACAWVIAVTFAYIVNKKIVFKSKSENGKTEVTKISKFLGSRLITLGIEQTGMYIFVDRLGFYRLLVKACIAIIVIIFNYLFSKLCIFHKRTEEQKGKEII